MKKLIQFSLVCFLFVACKNNKNGKFKTSNSDSDGLKGVKLTDSSNDVVSLKNTFPRQKNEEAIIGTWAFTGTDNATFVIDKSTITYPETFKTYKYLILGDSIKIKYDDYDGTYYFKVTNKDTLVMIGDEKQLYYRKKS